MIKLSSRRYSIFISFMIVFVFFASFGYSVSALSNEMVDTVDLENVINDSISESEIENTDNVYVSPIGDLRDKYDNSDIVGVVSIPNTSIDEMVLQSYDNDYYLSHNVYKKYYSYGSIEMDYRVDVNSSKKIIIFGHNFFYDNYNISPFEELEEYYDYEYFTNHKYITLYLEQEKRTYEIFSVYVETSDFTYMNMKFNTMSSWYSHLLKLKNKSLYDTGVSISSDDNILILQTCSSNKNYSKYKDKYLLVISKEI